VVSGVADPVSNIFARITAEYVVVPELAGPAAKLI